MEWGIYIKHIFLSQWNTNCHTKMSLSQYYCNGVSTIAIVSLPIWHQLNDWHSKKTKPSWSYRLFKKRMSQDEHLNWPPAKKHVKEQQTSSNLGEQGCRSGERTRLQPTWPGLEPQSWHHVGEFVVGSHPRSERFFSRCSSFLLNSKISISKFQFNLEFEGHRFAIHMDC